MGDVFLEANQNTEVVFLCVYNDFELYSLMLNSIKLVDLSASYEVVGIDNTTNKYSSMAEAYNDMLNTIRNDAVLIFLHQDIVFKQNTNLNLLVRLCRENPHSLYGVAGVENVGKNRSIISSITDYWCQYNSLAIDEIKEAFTFDDCFFASSKKLFDYVSFDKKTCPSFDFYGVDLCITCHLYNFNVYVVGIDLYHNSFGEITKSLAVVENKVAKKYKGSYKILTYTWGWVYTNSLLRHLYHIKEKLRKILKSLYRKITRYRR